MTDREIILKMIELINKGSTRLGSGYICIPEENMREINTTLKTAGFFDDNSKQNR